MLITKAITQENIEVPKIIKKSIHIFFEGTTLFKTLIENPIS